MTPLHDLSLGRRILLAVVIILFSLFLLFVASKLLGYEADAQPVPPITKWEKHILELDRQAIDDAYREQVKLLFSSWMKDDTGQPQRATNGARKAQNAYIDAMNGIDQREARGKTEP